MSATSETEEEESREDSESRGGDDRAPQKGRVARKWKKREEEVITYSHQSQDSQVDLLDYRWMTIVSNRWATPGELLQLVLSLLIISLFCVGSLLLLRLFLYGWQGLEVLFP